MAKYNLIPPTPLINAYQQGLLPQRNNQHYFYIDSSCRSDLSSFRLSSENRRILNKTSNVTYTKTPISKFILTNSIQKTITGWIKDLGWDFPTSSLKTVFTNHIFNYIYTWYNSDNEPIGYSVCYFDKTISHIAYVFYNPNISHSNLPIRFVLQFIIDSHRQGLKFAYLGRFSESVGYYKRNMPGFEYFSENNWLKYQK